MEWLKLAFISLELLILSDLTDAAVGANCTANSDCNEPNEACDVGGTDLCDCAANYVNDPCVYDCGEPPSQAGYSATKDGTTVEGQTATVTCDTGNGWSGSPSAISCNVGGWEALSGCSQSGGGGGDCGPPTNPTGYTLTANSGTSEGDSASVACATGFTEDSGPPAAVTCSGGSWASPSGCSPVDNGASEIKQTFSFAIMTGSLVITLMYM